MAEDRAQLDEIDRKHSSLRFEPEMAQILEPYVSQNFNYASWGSKLVKLGVMTSSDYMSTSAFMKKIIDSQMPLVYIFWVMASSQYIGGISGMIDSIYRIKKEMSGVRSYSNIKAEDHDILETLLYLRNLTNMRNDIYSLPSIGRRDRISHADFMVGNVPKLLEEYERQKNAGLIPVATHSSASPSAVASVSQDPTLEDFKKFIKKCGHPAFSNDPEFKKLLEYAQSEECNGFVLWLNLLASQN